MERRGDGRMGRGDGEVRVVRKKRTKSKSNRKGEVREEG